MNNQILFGIAVVPAIIGLTQVSKEVGLPSQFAPLVAILLGVLAGIAQLEAAHWQWIQAAVLGISMGLSAAGLYSGVKTIVPSGTPTNAPRQP